MCKNRTEDKDTTLLKTDPIMVTVGSPLFIYFLNIYILAENRKSHLPIGTQLYVVCSCK